ncbi:hypothetical protein COOONC_24797 [Cooperia oncophora]
MKLSHLSNVRNIRRVGSAASNKELPVNFFNWTETYLLSSDVVHKYGGYFLPAKVAEEKGFKFTDFRVDFSFPKRKSGIFGFVSNCNTSSKRELALKKLAKYMNVTIGGKCAPDKANVDICPLGGNCMNIYNDYPFYLAVENSVVFFLDHFAISSSPLKYEILYIGGYESAYRSATSPSYIGHIGTLLSPAQGPGPIARL